MLMEQFTWKIVSIDQITGHMTVEYTHDGNTQALNIPIPIATEDRDQWIAKFAPSLTWARKVQGFHELEEGQEGAGTFDSILEDVSETSTVAGNWNEAYLRAMIYQVMEEVKESEA